MIERILKFSFSLAYLIIMFSCSRGPLSDHIIPLKELNLANYNAQDECRNIELKDFVINIEHEAYSNSELNHLKLLVSFNGVVYQGSFKSTIKLNKLPVCNENGKNVVSISVALIDTVAGNVYYWQNKNTYYLKRFSEIDLELRSKHIPDIDDNAFSIKIIE